MGHKEVIDVHFREPKDFPVHITKGALVPKVNHAIRTKTVRPQ